MTKQDKIDWLLKILNRTYCDTCSGEYCDGCDRKSTNWGLAEETAAKIVEKISKGKE